MLLYEMFGCLASELKVRQSQDEQQHIVMFYTVQNSVSQILVR